MSPYSILIPIMLPLLGGFSMLFLKIKQTGRGISIGGNDSGFDKRFGFSPDFSAAATG